MGLFSGSRRRTSNTTNNNVDSSTTNFEDIEGGAVANGNFNRITTIQTDQGAVEEAFEFADEVSDDAFDFGRDSLIFAGVSQKESNEIVENAIESSSRSVGDALSTVSKLINSDIVTDNDNTKSIITAIAVAVIVLLLIIWIFRAGK